MYQIVEHEIHNVVPLKSGTSPNYNINNPLTKLLAAMESAGTAAGLQHYLVGSCNFLLPFRNLSFYGPSGENDWQVKDPHLQDNKNDFQKQNVAGFDLTETQLTRGYAHAGDWTGPFLRLTYTPGQHSVLSADGGPLLDDAVRLYLKVGDATTGAQTILVPYNTASHRYEIEIWAYDQGNLAGLLDAKGFAAFQRGELIARPDLVKGNLLEFEGPAFDAELDKAKAEGRSFEMFDYAVQHAMHPIRKLQIELAWSNKAGDRWDSQGGTNYRYEFAMVLRGWRNYLAAGSSPNPHGGTGSLEFRNLFSNYFGHEAKRKKELGDLWMTELGRELNQWNFDAYGNKPPPVDRELFMAVNYMDLHQVHANSAIGLHRHRDSLEAFLLISGDKGEHAYMVTGDWAKHRDRERAFEIRMMERGDIVLIRGGQLHALLNDGDTNMELFMFGGYD